MAGDIDIKLSLTEQGSNVKAVGRDLENAEKSARNLDANMTKTAASTNAAKEAQAKLKEQTAESNRKAEQFKGQLLAVAGQLGVMTSAAGAVGYAMRTWSEHIEKVKKGLEGATASALSLMQLRLMEQTGAAPAGSEELVKKTKAALPMIPEQQLNAAMATLGPLFAQQGMTGQDAMKTVLELYARKGFAGNLTDIVTELAPVIQSGNPASLAKYGLTFNAKKYEDIEDPQARSRAALEDMVKQLSSRSVLREMLTSEDPVIQARIQDLTAQTLTAENRELKSDDYRNMKRLQDEYLVRRGRANDGRDPTDIWSDPAGYIGYLERDPNFLTRVIGGTLKFLTMHVDTFNIAGLRNPELGGGNITINIYPPVLDER